MLCASPASSNPDSPRYGQWYSADDVIELFAPAPHRVQSVRTWLEQSGVAGHRISQSVNKQWIQFHANASEAAALFGTEYWVYEHGASGASTIACDE